MLTLLWDKQVQNLFWSIHHKQFWKLEKKHNSLTDVCNSCKRLPPQRKYLRPAQGWSSRIWMTATVLLSAHSKLKGRKSGIWEMSCTCNAKLKIADSNGSCLKNWKVTNSYISQTGFHLFMREKRHFKQPY